MAHRYRQYLKLCESWKVDKTKHGRDLGEFIRREVANYFKHGEATKITNEIQCEKYYNSLHRLVDNYYGKRYKNKLQLSASGMTSEECQKILATDQLEAIKATETGVIQKVMSRFGKSRG